MLFKKKKNNIITADAAASQIAEKIEKNIEIYTIPKRFFGNKPDSSKAKKTGVIILIFGLVILCGMGVFAYYLFYKGVPGLNSFLKFGGQGNELTNAPLQNTLNTNIKNENESLNTAVDFKKAESLEQGMPEEIKIASSTYETDNSSSTSPVANTEIVPVEQIKKIIPFAPDTDNDGLTDAEEVVFGTDPNKKDSDGDSFEDLAEIKNSYNPAGAGKILANPNFEIFSGSDSSIYYPKSWLAKKGDNNAVFMIDEGSRQFIQLMEQENPKNQTIEDWYKEQFNAVFIPPSQVLFKNGWTGIKSEDGLVAYLLDPLGEKIFVLSYSIGDRTAIDYPNIFSLMIESLK